MNHLWSVFVDSTILYKHLMCNFHFQGHKKWDDAKWYDFFVLCSIPCFLVLGSPLLISPFPIFPSLSKQYFINIKGRIFYRDATTFERWLKMFDKIKLKLSYVPTSHPILPPSLPSFLAYALDESSLLSYIYCYHWKLKEKEKASKKEKNNHGR